MAKLRRETWQISHDAHSFNKMFAFSFLNINYLKYLASERKAKTSTVDE